MAHQRSVCSAGEAVSTARPSPPRRAWAGFAGRRRGKLASAASLAIVLTLLLWPPLGGPASAQEEASSSRESRDDAVRTIPFDKLNQESQAKIERVVSRPSLYRRLPVETVECDPEMYIFLVRHPEVIVNLWKVLGVSSVMLKRTGPYSLHTADGVGTVCQADLIYGDEDTHILFADGVYDGKLVRRPAQGRCVMILQSSYYKRADGGVSIASRLDMFLQIDSAGIEFAARTLYPFVGRTADSNFSESAKFVGRVSYWAETDTEKLQQLAGRLTDVQPDVRDEFIEVTGNVGARAAQRRAAVDR